MAKQTYSGIYCIEGVWPDRYETSARPLLELLGDYHEIPTVHRIATNVGQFKHRLQQWANAEMVFAILYLWYHGSPGSVSPSEEDDFKLEEIADALDGCCSKCLIHFGSCKTLKLDPDRVGGFLERTGAVAVSGYTKNVGWIEPIALELLYLDHLQQTIASKRNQQYIDDSIMREVSGEMSKRHVRRLVDRSGFVIHLAADAL